MTPSESSETFADMAVALKLAAAKLKLDLEQLEIVAARVGLSPMGSSIAMREMQRNLDLVVGAHEILKSLADREPEVRALARTGSVRLTLARVVGGY